MCVSSNSHEPINFYDLASRFSVFYNIDALRSMQKCDATNGSPDEYDLRYEQNGQSRGYT